MTAIGVAGAVGVVLEDEDLAPDPFLFEPFLRTPHQALEDPLPRLVMGDDVLERVALRSGELRMRSDVQIEPGAILQKHVG